VDPSPPADPSSLGLSNVGPYAWEGISQPNCVLMVAEGKGALLLSSRSTTGTCMLLAVLVLASLPHVGSGHSCTVSSAILEDLACEQTDADSVHLIQKSRAAAVQASHAARHLQMPSPSATPGPREVLNGSHSGALLQDGPQEASSNGGILPAVPAGSDIWNETSGWMRVSAWHPAGVVSNLGPLHVVEWREVSYVNLTVLVCLCAVAYPAISISALIGLTVLVSMCLSVGPQAKGEASEESDSCRQLPPGTAYDRGEILEEAIKKLPVLSKKRLTASSQRIYAIWALFCCAMPSIMVFGTPLIMVALARPFPQEVLAALTLLTSAFIFSNGIYMVVFAGGAIMRMRRACSTDYGRILQDSRDSQTNPEDAHEVFHWVILPQYKEDVEVVSMALRSIASSSIAKSSIGIVLALEQRENNVSEKAEALKQIFGDQFREVIATYHPSGLPNDPAGKASNLAWAFKELTIREAARGSGVNEMSKVVLTVADADSEFATGYFECLSLNFLAESPRARECRIWQSPVFHVKNYHRQPSPVIVGTIFTSMQELAALSDPNAVRFPYSTYSLSMNLARRVGGWDPEWIAEDYHMGLKCFLMTMGESKVEPILLPTVNYVPEETGSWWGTVMARWTQAKRHALGFSDFAYFFMMLPLVFGYAAAKVKEERRIEGLHGFWRMATLGTTLIIRLVNIHVLLGVLSTYGALEALLKVVMRLFFSTDRNVEFFFLQMGFLPSVLMTASVGCTLVASFLFFQAYLLLEPRIEGKPMIKSHILHWLHNVLCVALCSPVYFIMLAIAIWQAALGVLTQRSFEYEVAPKPTSVQQRPVESPAAQSPAQSEGLAERQVFAIK